MLIVARLGGEGVDREPDGPRAGERDQGDVGMGDESWADVFADAGQIVDDSGGSAGFLEGACQAVGDQGGLLGGFEDDGVSGDDGGGGHAGQDRQGEIPRGDHDGGAAGFVEPLVGFTGKIRAGGSG